MLTSLNTRPRFIPSEKTESPRFRRLDLGRSRVELRKKCEKLSTQTMQITITRLKKEQWTMQRTRII